MDNGFFRNRRKYYLPKKFGQPDNYLNIWLAMLNLLDGEDYDQINKA